MRTLFFFLIYVAFFVGSLSAQKNEFSINPYLVVKPHQWALQFQNDIKKSKTDRELRRLWSDLVDRYNYFEEEGTLNKLTQFSRNEWRKTHAIMLLLFKKMYTCFSEAEQERISNEAFGSYRGLLSEAAFGLKDLSQRLYPYLVSDNGFAIFDQVTDFYFKAKPETKEEEIEYREDLTFLTSLWSDMLQFSPLTDESKKFIRHKIAQAQQSLGMNIIDQPLLIKWQHLEYLIDFIRIIVPSLDSSSRRNIYRLMRQHGLIVWGECCIVFFKEASKCFVTIVNGRTGEDKTIQIGDFSRDPSRFPPPFNDKAVFFTNKMGGFYIFFQGLGIEFDAKFDLVGVSKNSTTSSLQQHKWSAISHNIQDTQKWSRAVVLKLLDNERWRDKILQILSFRADNNPAYLSYVWSDSLFDKLCEMIVNPELWWYAAHRAIGILYNTYVRTDDVPKKIFYTLYTAYTSNYETVSQEALNALCLLFQMNNKFLLQLCFTQLGRDIDDMIFDAQVRRPYIIDSYSILNDINQTEAKVKEEILEEFSFNASINYYGKVFQGKIYFRKFMINQKEALSLESAILDFSFKGSWKIRKFHNTVFFIADIFQKNEKFVLVGKVDGSWDIDIEGSILSEAQFENFNFRKLCTNSNVGSFHLDD